MRKAWIIAVMVAAFGSPAYADAVDVQRELGLRLDRVVAALNSDDIDALLAEATPDVAFTAMNGRTAHGAEGVRAYFDAMRGAARMVEDYHIALSADGPAVLHDGDHAVAAGDAAAHYKFKGGMVLDARGRWTASLVRNFDGGWRIAAVHYSGNLFENPVLAAAKTATPIAGGVAGAGALVVGYFLGRWRQRRIAA